MKNKTMQKFRFSRVFLVFFFLSLFLISTIISPITANADMGPKASVRIQFKNMGSEVCYATLLSKTPSTGPSSVWNGEEETAYHNGNYEYAPIDYETWKAFAEYKDKDGFYYLQETWQVQETKELAWTYYPPKTFKILLYYPETETFAISDICEKYAFDTYYTVDMEGLAINSVEYNEGLSSDIRINAYKYYAWPPEIGTLLLRIVLTLAIEMGIALFFGIWEWKPLLLLIGVNVTTQFFLNLALNLIYFVSGGAFLTAAYVILELMIFGVEGLIYSLTMNKLTKRSKKAWLYWIYAFVGNLASFGTGLLLAEIIPWLF